MKTLLYTLLLFSSFGCDPSKPKTQEELTATATLTVEGRHLMTPCGEKVILRGVNEMFVWSNDRTGAETLPEIAKTGANCVRLVWSTKGSADELDHLIANCIAQNMIPIPELHDATGKIELVPDLVDYWVSDEVMAVMKKHEAYVLLNIANEPGLYNTTDSTFVSTYRKAIRRIRETGFKAPLMIDASNWGQDIDMLQANWKTLWKEDKDENLLFAVHTWWPKDSTDADPGSTQRVLTEIKESVDMKLPLVVAEFAPMGPGCKQYFDYETLITECQKNEIGWLSWSWGSAQNGDCEYMDMTKGGKFGDWQQTPDNANWGEIAAVTHEFSIKNTSIIPHYITQKGKCE